VWRAGLQDVCLHFVVNVRDSRGAFVANLPISSFYVRVGGREATVSSANAFNGTNWLIMIVDASASLSGDASNEQELWRAIKNLSEQLITLAPPSTKLALVVFSERVLRRLDFGHSRQELVTTIEQLPAPTGKTALWDSLLEPGSIFSDPIPGDAVVAISDGGDDFSKSRSRDVQSVFVAEGVRIFAIGLRHSYSESEEELIGGQDFARVAKPTGGNTGKQILNLQKSSQFLVRQVVRRSRTFLSFDAQDVTVAAIRAFGNPRIAT